VQLTLAPSSSSRWLLASQSEIARVKARLEVELGDLAVEAAARALREKTTPADQRRLAVEYLTRLEERS
jgi:F0F1-type ATP synthase membrane subunit b/b'